MKITQEFEVTKPVDAVWKFFQDIPAVAQCLPGAELTADHGDGSYEGTLEAKLGPMTATFEGKATVTPDAANRAGHIEGRGADKRGGSRGQVKVDYRLAASDGGTAVTVDADVVLSGPAAQFGRTGLIKEMSNRLINDFVGCLEAKLAAETDEAAAEIASGEVQGASLFFASLWSAIVRFFKRVISRR